MVRRIRNDKGINYPFTEITSPLGSSLKLNIDFDKLIDEGYDIIILNHQPGIGKTTSVMNYINQKLSKDSDFKFFYFTDKHKTIEEHIKKHFKSTPVNHWMALKHLTSYKDAEILSEDYHLDAKTISKITPIGKTTLDQYLDQFSKAYDLTRVFAPFNYLKSEHFNKLEKDVVFLDENISQLITFNFDIETAIEVFKIISQKDAKEWETKLRERDFYYFMNPDIQKNIIESYTNVVSEAYSDKEKNEKLLATLKKFNPYDFKHYVQFGSIYNWKENSYSFPLYYYDAFDEIQKGIPLIILDASFNKYLFSYFLESYNGEMRKLGFSDGFEDLNVCIFKSEVKNKENTTIYRMHPRGAWSKNSVVDHLKETTETISNEIKEIINTFGVENVGIITFKNIAQYVKLLGIDIEYFGGLRGTNILEKKPVLIIIGAWLPIPPSKQKLNEEEKKQGLENLLWEYFLLNFGDVSYNDSFVSAPQMIVDKYDKIKLATAHITVEKEYRESNNLASIAELNPISMINMQFFAESYQAYHRNRGLRDDKLIFSYGWFPEPEMLLNKTVKEPFFKYDLRNEFGIEKIFSKEELDGVLKPYKDVMNKWKPFILDLENEGKDNTEIAKTHHIWAGPGKGPNPNLIKEIREKIHNKFKEEK